MDTTGHESRATSEQSCRAGEASLLCPRVALDGPSPDADHHSYGTSNRQRGLSMAEACKSILSFMASRKNDDIALEVHGTRALTDEHAARSV